MYPKNRYIFRILSRWRRECWWGNILKMPCRDVHVAGKSTVSGVSALRVEEVALVRTIFLTEREASGAHSDGTTRMRHWTYFVWTSRTREFIRKRGWVSCSSQHVLGFTGCRNLTWMQLWLRNDSFREYWGLSAQELVAEHLQLVRLKEVSKYILNVTDTHWTRSDASSWRMEGMSY